MARHKRHEEHEDHASEAWLVAFADMMTLLMVTFLMLFSISNLDLQKFKTFQEAIAQGLGKNTHALAAQGAPAAGTPEDVAIGSTDGTPVASPSPVPVDAGKMLQRKDAEALKDKLDQTIAALGLSSQASTALDDRGVVVYVTSGVLFNSGAAALLPQGADLLSGLAPVFASVGNDLDVEGHTDDRPIASTAFPSNWELSTARATTVLRSLLTHQGIVPTRISASGYADTRPRVPNDTPDHRSTNRRVEVVVMVPVAPAAAATPAGTPAATPAAVPAVAPAASPAAVPAAVPAVAPAVAPAAPAATPAAAAPATQTHQAEAATGH